MSGNPFADLQQALSNLGLDFTLSGILLGAVLTVVLLIILTWVLDPRGRAKGGDAIFILSGGIGIAISYAVGWFPLWIIIFVGFIIAFIMINPLESGRGA